MIFGNTGRLTRIANKMRKMFAADIGYAVGNAVPALKAAADRITVDCHDHAIAAVIRELDAELGV